MQTNSSGDALMNKASLSPQSQNKTLLYLLDVVEKWFIEQETKEKNRGTL